MHRIESAARDTHPVRRSGRSPRRRAVHRVVAAVTTVVALLAMAGCYGPVTTTGIDVTVDCQYQINGGPFTDAGTSVLHVSLDAPTWSNPGATIPLRNPTVTGTQASASFPGVAVIHVGVSGLDDFETSVTLAPEDVSYFTNGFAARNPTTDFASAATRVNAPQHGVATVDFTEFSSVQVASVELAVVCRPLPGQPTRLATIGIRGDHNY